MSPIGRVFIVLNLVLAGTVVGFGGTYLQRQHDFKSQLMAEKEARQKQVEELQTNVTRLEGERNTFENAKTARETELDALKNRAAQLVDENKSLGQRVAAFEGGLQSLVSTANANKDQAKAAFEQAQAAYQMAIADQKVRDEAVTAKNAAEAENRTLKTTIASLQETIGGKDLEIAGLNKDLSENRLLVSVAKQKGFLEGMAAPSLAGRVTTANDRLCTIQVTDNPGDVDIRDWLHQKGPVSFAIYDNSGYKGEATATDYDESAKAVFCNLTLLNGATRIQEGDRAATKTR